MDKRKSHIKMSLIFFLALIIIGIPVMVDQIFDSPTAMLQQIPNLPAQPTVVGLPNHDQFFKGSS